MSILKIEDLTLEIEGSKILNNLNLEINESKIYAMVGPNGAGKSSLAFTIMGLDGYRDIEGDIIFNGDSIKDMSVTERAEKGITLAWQEPARFEGLTVRQFITSSTESGTDPEELLNRVGIDPTEYLDRPMDSGLSGGERKKIELASILAMDPDLVLLDEPDSGIDVASLEKIFDVIKTLRDNGTTVLLITHSSSALEHADNAFLMCDGDIVDHGPVSAVGKYFEEECFNCEAFSDQDKADEKKEVKKETK